MLIFSFLFFFFVYPFFDLFICFLFSFIMAECFFSQTVRWVLLFVLFNRNITVYLFQFLSSHLIFFSTKQINFSSFHFSIILNKSFISTNFFYLFPIPYSLNLSPFQPTGALRTECDKIISSSRARKCASFIIIGITRSLRALVLENHGIVGRWTSSRGTESTSATILWLIQSQTCALASNHSPIINILRAARALATGCTLWGYR